MFIISLGEIYLNFFVFVEPFAFQPRRKTQVQSGLRAVVKDVKQAFGVIKQC